MNEQRIIDQSYTAGNVYFRTNPNANTYILRAESEHQAETILALNGYGFRNSPDLYENAMSAFLTGFYDKAEPESRDNSDYIRTLAENAYSLGTQHGTFDHQHGFDATENTIKGVARLQSHISAVQSAYIAGYIDATAPDPRYIPEIDYVVQWVNDESPDLSFLGEYKDHPNHDKWIYDRKSGYIESPRGYKRFIGVVWERNQYRYLELENAYNFASAKGDADLMERLNNGYESVLGCIVTAVYNGVEIAHDSLWGIIGADDRYKAEIESECTAECKNAAEMWLDSVRATR